LVPVLRTACSGEPDSQAHQGAAATQLSISTAPGTSPPAWRFLDPRTGADIGRAAFPAPGPFPLGSVLHATRAVICAPWNRLAYAERGGPHSDWNATSWQTTAPQYTSARTIPDMLARVRAEVIISPARLEPLPPLSTEKP